MSGPRLGLGLAGALVAAGVIALFAYGCERRTRTLYGFRGEAAANRYLAAERLLQAMGTEVRTVDDLAQLDALPPADATIFMPVDRGGVLSRARSATLLDWVVGGGHLIVTTWELWDDEARDEDLILDALGVRQFMRDDQTGLEAEVGEPELAQARFEGRAEPLVAHFDPRYQVVVRADRSPVLAFSDANGTHLATLALGDGYLTVLTDDYFFTNGRIGGRDHAELVWRLARLGGRAGPVWMVPELGWPSALTLAWRWGWMLLCSLAALAAFWVWSVSRRSGPVQPDEPLDRRRLMEHVEASGRFLARRGGEEALAGAVRDALMARVRARHPTWVDLDPAELAARLGGCADLPRERVERALAPAAGWSRDGFVTHIATLEAIRHAL